MVRAQVPLRVSLAGIELYRDYVSPILTRSGVRCRFTPTCSRYASAVLQKYGFVRGSWLTVRRIARCGPWTPAGTVDPP
jgi:putative membrane protein insertion efficiency factor